MKALFTLLVIFVVIATTDEFHAQESYYAASSSSSSYTGANIGNANILRWKSMPINWHLNFDGYTHTLTKQNVKDKIIAAYAKWDAVSEANLSFSYISETTNTYEIDGKNVHFFATDGDPIFLETNEEILGAPAEIDSDDWLGLTIMTSYDTGEILDIDIAYNDKYYSLGGNLNRAIAHEIGHKIGLGHTTTGSTLSALMHGSTAIDYLKDPDIRGAQFLYGGLVQHDIDDSNTSNIYIDWDWEMASNVSLSLTDGCDIHIPAGVTLTVNGPSNLRSGTCFLEDDSKIILKGDVALGDFGVAYTFKQKVGSPGRWKGIEINNYPNSTTNNIQFVHISGSEFGLHLNNAQNMYIQRSTFDGNNLNLKITSGQDNTFYRNEIKNSNGNGIEISNSADVEFHKNTIKDNDGEGISITGSSPLIHYNNIDNNSLNGILVSSYSSPDIEHNRIVNSTNRGVLVISNSAPDLEYNLIQQNDVHGVTTILNCPADFAHNTIYDNTYDGIQVSTDSDINGSTWGYNEILSNSQYGISAGSSSAVDFYYGLNTIAGNTSYELYADANSSIDAVANFFDGQHNDYSGTCYTTGYLGSAATGVGCGFDYNDDPSHPSFKMNIAKTPILVNYNAGNGYGQSLEESIDEAFQSNNWKSVRRNVADYTKQLIRGKRPNGAYNSILKNRNANSIPREIMRKIRMLSVLHDVVLDNNYEGALKKLDDLLTEFPDNKLSYLAQKANIYINNLEDGSRAQETLGQLYNVEGVDEEIKSLLLSQFERQLNDKLGIEVNPALNVKNVITEDKVIPGDYRLSQNYPNPFNPVTSIKYALSESHHVTLRVYNITGQLVAELVNESKSAGFHNVQWDASSIASGVYIYTISAGGFSETKKMVVMK